jgi:hypothetical protein
VIEVLDAGGTDHGVNEVDLSDEGKWHSGRRGSKDEGKADGFMSLHDAG